MLSSKLEAAAELSVDASIRASFAINALSAVRELCNEAANGQPDAGLCHVNADNFACLLGLIVDELRAAHDA